MELTWDYIAGFIDGEGCITIHKGKPRRKSLEYQPLFVLANTKRIILDEIRLHLNNCPMYKQVRPQYTHRNDCYYLRLYNYNVYNLCKLLKNKLVLKRKQAEIIMQFYDKNNSTIGRSGLSQSEVNRREELYLQIRKLNKKGK